MGLDMYLYHDVYVWQSLDNDAPPAFEITNIQEDESMMSANTIKSIDPKKIKYIKEEVAYWRKANAIHSWFVQNVQDGVDDCQEYFVSREKLSELLETVKKVLERKDPSYAVETLTPKEGFFFGSSDIDDWYWEDMKNTKKMLEEILADERKTSFVYRSSW